MSDIRESLKELLKAAAHSEMCDLEHICTLIDTKNNKATEIHLKDLYNESTEGFRVMNRMKDHNSVAVKVTDSCSQETVPFIREILYEVEREAYYRKEGGKEC